MNRDAAASPEPRALAGRRVRHILLVTRSYPPLSVVSSLRMYQWAKYWSREGVRVTVLTTRKHWFFGACDLQGPPLPGVEVVEVEFIPATVLRLLERWRPRRPAAPDPGGGRRPGTEHGVLIRAKAWLRRRRRSSRLLPAVEFYDLWVGKAVRTGTRLIAEDPVDVIVSSFGPPAAHAIGARLKRRFPEVRWVADYRDPWTFRDDFTLRGLTGYLERRRERGSVGRHADLLICVSNPLAEQTRRFTATPVIVMENGFDPEGQPALAEAVPDPLRASWGAVTLVYTGTLHADQQDPTLLLQAVARLASAGGDAADRLRVLFFGERHAGLQQRIDAAGVGRQVRLSGYVDHATALWAQRHASALLLFEDQASAARGVLRGKMFEYLQAGRPILGVGFTADTEVGRILVEAGVGTVCGVDQERIRRYLEDLLAHGELAGFAPAPAVLERFHRDVQARRLLAEMDRLLAERGRGLRPLLPERPGYAGGGS